jgi:hypothetical protein
MGNSLDVEKTPVGLKADLSESGQILQQFADAEVAGVVDGGFGTEGAALLVILLDPCVLVIDVQRGDHSIGDHARAEPARRPRRDAAVEDQLHLTGSADVEILANHFLEKHPSRDGPVEDLSEGELRLKNRDLITEARLAVGGAERMRQQSQPLSQQSVDLLRAQSVADCLETPGIIAFQHAVIERFESDPLLCQLLFGVLMPLALMRRAQVNLSPDKQSPASAPVGQQSLAL